jgi:hypothetical protein
MRSVDFSYYNSLCPDVELMTADGNKITLRSLLGHVIVMKFTENGPTDASNLVFLTHLYNKFKTWGLQLYFINKSNDREMSPMSDAFSVPRIVDDGYLSALFNATQGDIFLIDKDLKIKLKTGDISNQNLYQVVRRFLFEDKRPFSESTENDKECLSEVFSHLLYKNTQSRKTARLMTDVKLDKCIIYLSISNCFQCPENYRIKALKELAERKALDKKRIIVLFGRGNDFELISHFVKNTALDEYFTVGVIQDTDKDYEDSYWNIFRFDLDPRLIVLDRGTIIFIENDKNHSNIQLVERLI